MIVIFRMGFSVVVIVIATGDMIVLLFIAWVAVSETVRVFV